jgi:hypothetical protein
VCFQFVSCQFFRVAGNSLSTYSGLSFQSVLRQFHVPVFQLSAECCSNQWRWDVNQSYYFLKKHYSENAFHFQNFNLLSMKTLISNAFPKGKLLFVTLLKLLCFWQFFICRDWISIFQQTDSKNLFINFLCPLNRLLKQQLIHIQIKVWS